MRIEKKINFQVSYNKTFPFEVLDISFQCEFQMLHMNNIIQIFSKIMKIVIIFCKNGDKSWKWGWENCWTQKLNSKLRMKNCWSWDLSVMYVECQKSRNIFSEVCRHVYDGARFHRHSYLVFSMSNNWWSLGKTKQPPRGTF